MTLQTFPTLPGLEFPVGRAPKKSDLSQRAISGRVADQPMWTAPLYDITLSFSGLHTGAQPVGGFGANEWQSFSDFWKTVVFTPPFNRFKFVDPDDSAVADQLFATGDGATETFQLTRALASFPEPVYVPICEPAPASVFKDRGNFSGAATIFADDGNFGAATAWNDDGYFSTMQVFLGAYAMQPTTPLAPWGFANGSADASAGIVVIVPAPAARVPLTWTGTYAWLCRFTDDMLNFSNFMFAFKSLKKCAIETVRL